MGGGREIYDDKWVILAAARCPNHVGHGFAVQSRKAGAEAQSNAFGMGRTR